MRVLRCAKFCFGTFVAFAVAIGSTSVAAAAKPRPGGPGPLGCPCPPETAPVECNGVIYPNLCVASCAGATACLPIDPGPTP